MLTNQRKAAVNMLRSLRMKGNKVGAGFGKIGNEAINRASHQMHVDNRPGQRADSRADQRTDGHVRHIVIVHDIEVNPVGAGRDHVGDFRPQTGKVGRKNAGGKNRHRGIHKNDSSLGMGCSRAFMKRPGRVHNSKICPSCNICGENRVPCPAISRMIRSA